eukprot:2598515-Prymnesium_polylepis.1
MPLSAARRCVPHLCSPVMIVERNGAPPAASALATASTCCASSDVGTRTSARTRPAGVRPVVASVCRRRWTSGARYASVFPLPVWSASATSCPLAIGLNPIACT